MSRVKALIIDDERYSVKAIMQKVPWADITAEGVEVLPSYNVEQAKKIIEGGEIDFILCDIEMPRNNGIDLIKWIRQEQYPVEIIIITCHEVFQYAKEAITLNVYDYCVKPLDFLQLEISIRNLADRILKERNAKKQSNLGHFYVENRVDLERIFWKKVLEGYYEGNDNCMLEEAGRIGLEQDFQEEISLSVICVKQFNVHLVRWNQDKLIQSVSNVVKGVFDHDMDSNRVLSFGSDIVVISLKKDFDWQLKQCKEASKVCKELLKIKVCCYVGEKIPYEKLYDNFLNLRKMAAEDVQHLEGVFVEGMIGRAIEVLPLDIPGIIQEKLEFARYEEFIQELSHWVGMMKQEEISLSSLQSLQENIIQVIYSHLMKMGITARTLLQDEELKEKYETASMSIELLIDWVKAMIVKLENITEERKNNNSRSAAIHKMKDYIELHLTEDITRREIAQSVHLNVDYAARLFKQEEQISMLDYLIKRRISKAVLLMQTTELSISDVAFRSGFINSSHFSTLFKKSIGVSPREFRNGEETK